jgi:hypothetical protein
MRTRLVDIEGVDLEECRRFLGAITRDMIESLGRTLLKNEDPQAVAKWLSSAINKDLRQAGELSAN